MEVFWKIDEVVRINLSVYQFCLDVILQQRPGHLEGKVSKSYLVQEKKTLIKSKNIEGWNLKKKTTKQGRNDTTLRCHNTTPQSSDYGVPSQHFFDILLLLWDCNGWRKIITMKNDTTLRYHNTTPQSSSGLASQSHNKIKMSKDIAMVN